MLLRIVLIIGMERLAQHVSNCRLERKVVVFNLGDAVVVTFDPLVGLGVVGIDRSVVDAVLGAGLIEEGSASWLALASGAEVIGQLSVLWSVSTVGMRNRSLAWGHSKAVVSAVLSG